jgi:hypothetical protein
MPAAWGTCDGPEKSIPMSSLGTHRKPPTGPGVPTDTKFKKRHRFFATDAVRLLEEVFAVAQRGAPVYCNGGGLDLHVTQIAAITNLSLWATSFKCSGDQRPNTALIFGSHRSEPVGRALVCRFGRDLTAISCVVKQCTDFSVHVKQQFSITLVAEPSTKVREKPATKVSANRSDNTGPCVRDMLHEGFFTVRPRDTTSVGDLPSAEQYCCSRG